MNFGYQKKKNMANDGSVGKIEPCSWNLLKNSVGDVHDWIEPQSFSDNLALHCLPKYTSVVKGTYDLNTEEKTSAYQAAIFIITSQSGLH